MTIHEMYRYFALMLVLGLTAAQIREPPRAEKQEVKHVAQLGEEAKLRCPIEGFPAPIVTWARQGESIDYTWVRFKINKRSLKIKEVEEGDEGLYLCKGVNGFGKVEVRVELIVIDPADFSEELTATDLSELHPPRITRTDPRDTGQAIILHTGETFRLSCEVSGFPLPRISWFRDNALIQQQEAGERNRSSLLVVAHSFREAGQYTCQADNRVGKPISQYFHVQVRDGRPSPPEIYAGPANLTVELGEPARLTCEVRGARSPHIKWLRRLEGEGGVDSHRLTMEDNRESFPVGEEKFVMVDGAWTEEVRLGEFVSELFVSSVDERSGGLYVCFVTSDGGGFDYRPAYLTITQAEVYREPAVQVSLTVLVVVGVLLLLLLLLAILVCVKRRQKTTTTTATTNTTTSNSSSTTSTNSSSEEEVQKALLVKQYEAGEGGGDPTPPFHPHLLDRGACSKLVWSSTNNKPSRRSKQDDVKIVVNKMDELLSHNTVNLQHVGLSDSLNSLAQPPYYVSAAAENCYENQYEVPGVPGNRCRVPGYGEFYNHLRPTHNHPPQPGENRYFPVTSGRC